MTDRGDSVPADPFEAARLIDAALAKSEAYYEVETNLAWSRVKLSELDEPARSIAVAGSAAFQYSVRHGRTERNQSIFIPMFEFEDGTEVPPSPRNASPDWARIWEELMESATHPAGVARFSDLLFVRGMGRVGAFASKAVDAYVALADTSWHALDQSHGLLRANDIVTLAKMTEGRTRVVAAMASFAQRGTERRYGPGAVFPIIEVLSRDSQMVPLARNLIVELKSIHAEDAHLMESLLQIERGITPVQERADIDRAIVRNWRESAKRRGGAEQLFDLERAIRAAESAGLADEAEAARRDLQAVNREDLGLQRIRHEFELPREVVDEYLSQFTSANDWREALERVSLHRPLTGELSDNEQAVENHAKEAPLSAMLNRVKLGSDGLPRWQAKNDEQEEDAKLAEQELLRLQIAAPLFAEGLRVVNETYEVSTQALRSYFESRPNCDPEFAAILSEALSQYWQGNYNLAGILVLFQVEARIRTLILAADRAIYELQKKNRQGQYPALGQLLKELGRLGLDRSWYRYIWTVFASPAGLNLRNEVAHGFAGPLSEAHAAVILHTVLYLTLLRPSQE